MPELSPLIVTNTASSTDIPALAFSYQLIAPPTGASIDTNGIITWTPTEAQGPSANLITTVVTDAGSPPKRATNSFVVTVGEWNSAPMLPSQADRLNAGLTPMVVTNTASDSDLPANALNYSLAQAPAGAAISAKGVITWVPTLDQAGQANVFRTIVTDFNPQAPTNKVLSATNSFTVTITDAHNGPVLPTPPNYVIDEGTLLTVTNTAANYDVPATLLTYSIFGAPIANCSINANGIITFAPSELQGNTTNRIRTVVYDDGMPSLDDQNEFYVTVRESNSPPVLPPQANRALTPTQALIVTNTATDPDLPANPLTYTLLTAPAGAAISTNGIITWTPAVAQVPSTNVFTTSVTDTNSGAWSYNQRSATNSFTVVINAVHNGPSLPQDVPEQQVFELATISITNTAAVSDIPSLNLTYTLESSLPGPVVDTNGIITWTPTEEQGPGTNIITTVVIDDGIPSFGATNTITVVVLETNQAPVLPAQPNISIAVLGGVRVTNTASDTDVPVNELTYELQSRARRCHDQCLGRRSSGHRRSSTLTLPRASQRSSGTAARRQ